MGMIRIFFVCLFLVGCASVGDVLPIGVDTYTVSSRISGGRSWPKVKALGIERANEFCEEKSKRMEVINWTTHGVRGWSPLDAELSFKCI